MSVRASMALLCLVKSHVQVELNIPAYADCRSLSKESQISDHLPPSDTLTSRIEPDVRQHVTDQRRKLLAP